MTNRLREGSSEPNSYSKAGTVAEPATAMIILSRDLRKMHVVLDTHC